MQGGSALPDSIVKLKKLISRMPGFSERGTERFLEWWWQKNQDSREFLKNWVDFAELKECQDCFFFAHAGKCDFCQDEKRDPKVVCVVSSPFTAAQIDAAADYRGLFFVLGGEVGGSHSSKSTELIKKRLEILKKRVTNEKISEIILATDFTTKGEATALLTKDILKETPTKFSRLASGFQWGDEVPYSDPGTLKKAVEGRSNY